MGILASVWSLRDYETRIEARYRAVLRLSRPLLRATRWRGSTLARRQRVVAIVGSQGKTTATRCVRAALGLPAMALAEESANHRGRMAMVLLRQSAFRRYATVESGIASPGQMRKQVRAIRPVITVVTSIGTEHLRSFGSVERLRDEKADALRVLPPGGTAVVNGDDENVRWMATQTSARVVTYGFDEGNDIRASNVALDWPRGTTFTVSAGGRDYAVRTRLIGRTMVYAALAGIAVAHVEGVDLDAAIARLSRMRPTRRRNQPIRLASGAWALADDCNGAIETVEAALALLRELPARRRFIVLGQLEMPPGPQRAAYRRVGAIAGKVADRVLIVGQLEQYWPSLRDAGFAKADLSVVATATDAIDILRDELGPGDVVLLKGRGEQRLIRVGLGLAGRTVRCRRETCRLPNDFCDACPLLERGR